MNIKKILIEVDGSAASLVRLESGFNLCENLGASASALCIVPNYLPTAAMGSVHGGWYIGEQVIEERRKEAMAAAAEVQESCERVAKKRDVNLEWVQKEGDLVTATCDEVRFYDMLLLGRPNTVNEPQLRTSDLNGILLSSGKPVLLIPGAAPIFKKPIGKIVFAWDGSREAVQALHHGMPFFEQAESVMVVAAYQHKERKGTVEADAEKLRSYLALHDVNASCHALKKRHRSTGELINNYAEECEADLVVMGAYGHSRFREIMLGGATQHMLHHATVPVLFAH